MSETQTAAEAPAPTIPNYSVSDPVKREINGTSYSVRTVRFGEPIQTAEIRDLDEADQWDLSEIAGSNADNLAWLSRAMAATATLSINGVPLATGTGITGSRERKVNILREALRRLGRDGVMAVLRTMNTVADAADPADVAGNSSAALDSAIA